MHSFLNQKDHPMSRITIPATIEAAPEASRPLLEAVRARVGAVPNLYRLVAWSPAALSGLLGLSGALSQDNLDPVTRERLALVTAELNGCDYCTAAHGFIAGKAGVPAEEILLNRAGQATEAKADAALKFATAVIERRGRIDQAALDAVRAAGYSDAQVLEIVAHVALNTFTNYVNEVAQTDVDFPKVSRPVVA